MTDLSQIQTPTKYPPLQTGDHLSRAEFERRYQAQTRIKKAELIEGIVYMPSPVHYHSHAYLHSHIMGLLFNYSAATPGVASADNVTIRLDVDNEVQPDAILRLDEALGGKSHVTEDDYIAGPPELIVEIAASSVAYDLYEKRNIYCRNGVQEYLVLIAYEQETRWYELRTGEYHLLDPDQDGLLKSRVFPGFYFDPVQFWANDLVGLLETLALGLKSADHAVFLKRLEKGI